MALGFLTWLAYTAGNGNKEMNQTTYLFTLALDYKDVVAQVTRRLSDDGFQVLRTFDLQAAIAAHIKCPCPHHGTELCDCQMAVLLVYGQDQYPISLVVHGHDDRMQLSMVSTPQQQPSPELERAVIRALGSEQKTLSSQDLRTNVTR